MLADRNPGDEDKLEIYYYTSMGSFLILILSSSIIAIQPLATSFSIWGSTFFNIFAIRKGFALLSLRVMMLGLFVDLSVKIALKSKSWVIMVLFSFAARSNIE